MLKVQDKDADVSKANEDDVLKKEEADSTYSDAEIQDVVGKDEQLVGSSGVRAEVVTENKDAEDELGKR